MSRNPLIEVFYGGSFERTASGMTSHISSGPFHTVPDYLEQIICGIDESSQTNIPVQWRIGDFPKLFSRHHPVLFDRTKINDDERNLINLVMAQFLGNLSSPSESRTRSFSSVIHSIVRNRQLSFYNPSPLYENDAVIYKDIEQQISLFHLKDYHSELAPVSLTLFCIQQQMKQFNYLINFLGLKQKFFSLNFESHHTLTLENINLFTNHISSQLTKVLDTHVSSKGASPIINTQFMKHIGNLFSIAFSQFPTNPFQCISTLHGMNLSFSFHDSSYTFLIQLIRQTLSFLEIHIFLTEMISKVESCITHLLSIYAAFIESLEQRNVTHNTPLPIKVFFKYLGKLIKILDVTSSKYVLSESNNIEITDLDIPNDSEDNKFFLMIVQKIEKIPNCADVTISESCKSSLEECFYLLRNKLKQAQDTALKSIYSYYLSFSTSINTSSILNKINCIFEKVSNLLLEIMPRISFTKQFKETYALVLNSYFNFLSEPTFGHSSFMDFIEQTTGSPADRPSNQASSNSSHSKVNSVEVAGKVTTLTFHPELSSPLWVLTLYSEGLASVFSTSNNEPLSLLYQTTYSSFVDNTQLNSTSQSNSRNITNVSVQSQEGTISESLESKNHKDIQTINNPTSSNELPSVVSIADKALFLTSTIVTLAEKIPGCLVLLLNKSVSRPWLHSLSKLCQCSNNPLALSNSIMNIAERLLHLALPYSVHLPMINNSTCNGQNESSSSSVVQDNTVFCNSSSSRRIILISGIDSRKSDKVLEHFITELFPKSLKLSITTFSKPIVQKMYGNHPHNAIGTKLEPWTNPSFLSPLHSNTSKNSSIFLSVREFYLAFIFLYDIYMALTTIIKGFHNNYLHKLFLRLIDIAKTQTNSSCLHHHQSESHSLVETSHVPEFCYSLTHALSILHYSSFFSKEDMPALALRNDSDHSFSLSGKEATYVLTKAIDCKRNSRNTTSQEGQTSSEDATDAQIEKKENGKVNVQNLSIVKHHTQSSNTNIIFPFIFTNSSNSYQWRGIVVKLRRYIFFIPISELQCHFQSIQNKRLLSKTSMNLFLSGLLKGPLLPIIKASYSKVQTKLLSHSALQSNTIEPFNPSTYLYIIEITNILQSHSRMPPVTLLNLLSLLDNHISKLNPTVNGFFPIDTVNPHTSETFLAIVSPIFIEIIRVVVDIVQNHSSYYSPIHEKLLKLIIEEPVTTKKSSRKSQPEHNQQNNKLNNKPSQTATSYEPAQLCLATLYVIHSACERIYKRLESFYITILKQLPDNLAIDDYIFPFLRRYTEFLLLLQISLTVYKPIDSSSYIPDSFLSLSNLLNEVFRINIGTEFFASKPFLCQLAFYLEIIASELGTYKSGRNQIDYQSYAKQVSIRIKDRISAEISRVNSIQTIPTGGKSLPRLPDHLVYSSTKITDKIQERRNLFNEYMETMGSTLLLPYNTPLLYPSSWLLARQQSTTVIEHHHYKYISLFSSKIIDKLPYDANQFSSVSNVLFEHHNPSSDSSLYVLLYRFCNYLLLLLNRDIILINRILESFCVGNIFSTADDQFLKFECCGEDISALQQDNMNCTSSGMNKISESCEKDLIYKFGDQLYKLLLQDSAQSSIKNAKSYVNPSHPLFSIICRCISKQKKDRPNFAELKMLFASLHSPDTTNIFDDRYKLESELQVAHVKNHYLVRLLSVPHFDRDTSTEAFDTIRLVQCINCGRVFYSSLECHIGCECNPSKNTPIVAEKYSYYDLTKFRRIVADSIQSANSSSSESSSSELSNTRLISRNKVLNIKISQLIKIGKDEYLGEQARSQLEKTKSAIQGSNLNYSSPSSLRRVFPSNDNQPSHDTADHGNTHTDEFHSITSSNTSQHSSSASPNQLRVNAQQKGFSSSRRERTWTSGSKCASEQNNTTTPYWSTIISGGTDLQKELNEQLEAGVLPMDWPRLPISSNSELDNKVDDNTALLFKTASYFNDAMPFLTNIASSENIFQYFLDNCLLEETKKITPALARFAQVCLSHRKGNELFVDNEACLSSPLSYEFTPEQFTPDAIFWTRPQYVETTYSSYSFMEMRQIAFIEEHKTDKSFMEKSCLTQIASYSLCILESNPGRLFIYARQVSPSYYRLIRFETVPGTTRSGEKRFTILCTTTILTYEGGLRHYYDFLQQPLSFYGVQTIATPPSSISVLRSHVPIRYYTYKIGRTSIVYDLEAMQRYQSSSRPYGYLPIVKTYRYDYGQLIALEIMMTLLRVFFTFDSKKQCFCIRRTLQPFHVRMLFERISMSCGQAVIPWQGRELCNEYLPKDFNTNNAINVITFVNGIREQLIELEHMHLCHRDVSLANIVFWPGRADSSNYSKAPNTSVSSHLLSLQEILFSDFREERRNRDLNSSSIRRKYVGLVNLNNTCYMNSALQCLSHTLPLTAHFLSYRFAFEINPDNSFECKDKIAHTYGKWVRSMWDNKSSVVTPKDLKTVIGHFNNQFKGYHQHDSQELLSFLIDYLVCSCLVFLVLLFIATIIYVYFVSSTKI